MAVAGSIVFSEQSMGRGPRRPISMITLAWTSSSGGAVSGLPVLTSAGIVDYLSGEIERVVFIPGTGGVQPTNGYSVTLLDGNGVDVLAGQGASLSNVTTTHIKPGVKITDGTTTSIAPIAIDDQLTLNVSAAGNAKQGTVVLYLRA